MLHKPFERNEDATMLQNAVRDGNWKEQQRKERRYDLTKAFMVARLSREGLGNILRTDEARECVALVDAVLDELEE